MTEEEMTKGCGNCGHKPLEHPWLQCKKFIPECQSQETPNHSPDFAVANKDTPSETNSERNLSDTEGTSKSQEYPKGQIETLSDKIMSVRNPLFKDPIEDNNILLIKYVREFIAKIMSPIQAELNFMEKEEIDTQSSRVVKMLLTQIVKKIKKEAGKGLI